MKPLFMDIKDKVTISDTRFCPPHRWPHTLGPKICDEKCHFHKAWWRMLHHCPLCKILKCPHYDFMVSKYRKFKEGKK